ncbi:MAG TPA: phytanoyl-CoA dioxygenase family protein [Flavisolibacter sp.]|nr:phytanoyl-CoA dioxygenase family protein [Flavisolibacter sp.]
MPQASHMAAKEAIEQNGFAVIEKVYTDTALHTIIAAIEQVSGSAKATFRKGSALFAIRQFLKEVPEAVPALFSTKLTAIIHDIFGKDFFVVKSIYFDKPPQSNWFVPYHQDLTISVRAKAPVPGYGPWTVKQNQYAVQPPPEILQNNFTIRIHLDDTDEKNGALRVIPGSHVNGICRPEAVDLLQQKEVSAIVPKGGIMLMRPLLFHASGRTTNNKRRRVIHMEFSNSQLPPPLQWSEVVR